MVDNVSIGMFSSRLKASNAVCSNVKNDEYSLSRLSLSSWEMLPKCVNTNSISFLHTSGFWHAVIRFMMVQMQQLMVWSVLSVVRQVENST